uniref:Uncharacterized protein n=1 Tax=Megaselia scalaris TaxID=36166 RepID=T1H3W5_MEGSC
MSLHIQHQGGRFKWHPCKIIKNALQTKIWIKEHIPEEWSTSIICSIHKKDNKRECKNYRGISLLTIANMISTRTRNGQRDKGSNLEHKDHVETRSHTRSKE